jgi:AraC-like DNA-binding protein
MSSIETAIRGGAIALLVLLAVLTLWQAQRTPAHLLGGLFALSAAAFALVSMPQLAFLPVLWLTPFRLVSAGTSTVFWLWSCAIFDDEFKLGWRHLTLWLAMLALALLCFTRSVPSLYLALNLVSLGFIALGIWEALSGHGADLVEGRRRMRPVLALAAAVYAGAIVVVELLWRDRLFVAPTSMINAAGLLALAFVFVLNQIGRLGAAPLNEVPGRVAAPASSAAAIDPRDVPILGALNHLMDVDKLYRESGLSVGALAARLEIPEYRLRRVINGELGYRNFASFVNKYRLAEAMAALSDPSQIEVPVLTIAMDAGFQSIGPFNRAFKVATGTTPTEYRRIQLNGGAPKPAVAAG